MRHVTFALGAAITALLLATAALSLVYTPRDPLKMSITGRLQGPSGPHPFGTDQYGRDVLSRVMRGTVTSIAVGVIAVGIGAALGMWIGILSGYAGGALDEGFMRLVDAIQGFPAILSALLFAAVFTPGIALSMVAIGIAFVPAFARLTRAGFLELREREFVVAARALGAPDRRLVARVSQVLATYAGPAAVMSFDPAQIAMLRALAPAIPRDRRSQTSNRFFAIWCKIGSSWTSPS